ncbi:MAG: protein jag [Clostridia bacterium]|nr:protein jag [Clostridia bacterium]
MDKLIQGEFTGKTVDDAVKEGLLTLGLSKEDVEIEVLEEGKKKLFGSIKARVKITKKLSDGERAVDFLDEMFRILEITATSELVSEDEKISINITATNSHAVIGRRGEVLDALQSLAGAVANTGREEYRRVVIDCENYRAEREESLKKHALKLADKAVATSKKVRMDAMNPYERRIVHAVLADNTEVKTISEGKEPNRYIVIVPNNYNPENDRKYRGGKKPYGKKFDDRKDGKKSFNRDRSDRGDRRGDRKPYNRDRGGRSDFKKDVRKPAPFFGTFIGKNENAQSPEKKDEI